MNEIVWILVGIGLLIWVMFDLWGGHTWLLHKIERDKEPWTYWMVVSIWLIISLWVLDVFRWSHG